MSDDTERNDAIRTLIDGAEAAFWDIRGDWEDPRGYIRHGLGCLHAAQLVFDGVAVDDERIIKALAQVDEWRDARSEVDNA